MNKKYSELNNGEKVFYIDKGSHEDVLVLLHGNMSSSIHFLPIIDSLSKIYRVIAPDMRGFGDSSYNAPIRSLNDLGDDVLLLLESLDIKKINLLGWSTGGAIALKMASDRPNYVKKLILLESASYRGYPIFKKDKNGNSLIGEYYDNKKNLSQDTVQVLPFYNAFENNDSSYLNMIWNKFIYTVNKPTKEDSELFISETMKQQNIVDIDWCLTIFNMSNSSNGVTDGDGSIKKVICPVLSLWSEKDIVVPEYMIDETIKELKNGRKVVLTNSGHNPLIDCPKEVIMHIKGFIS